MQFVGSSAGGKKADDHTFDDSTVKGKLRHIVHDAGHAVHEAYDKITHHDDDDEQHQHQPPKEEGGAAGGGAQQPSPEHDGSVGLRNRL